MAVGVWTLALKSDYISLLASNTYLASAYILVLAGVVVMVTGLLGCCATFKERQSLLRPVSRTAGTGWGGLGGGLPAAGWGWLWGPDWGGRHWGRGAECDTAGSSAVLPGVPALR